MTETQYRQGELPAHIEEIIQSINRMHDAHREGATRYDRLVGEATALMAGPRFIGALVLVVAGWMAFNLLCPSFGRPPLDPPPFEWLERGMTFLSLLMVAVILAEQRREDQIGRQREFLTLQLAILSERKAAKLIALVEEFRRDSPQIQDRVDEQAEELSQSASPQTVLDAINQSGRTD